MKKVLIGFILDGNGGGVDKYILNFCDAVRSADTKIDVLTNHIDRHLYDVLQQKNSELFEVSSLSNPSLQYKQIYDLVKSQAYDVVYLCFSTAIGYRAAKAAKDAGVKKVIVHSHNAGYDCENPYKRACMTFLHRYSKPKLARYATDYLTCSDKAAEWMFPSKIVRSGRVVRVQNAVNTSDFVFSEQKRATLRNALGLNNNYVIGHVGNFFYQKNHTFLIDVFRQVAQMDDSARLVLLGDGPLMEKIQIKAENLQLGDRILFLGKQNVADGYMSAFDVFVLPSNFEGMPIVSVEAQCANLPCVFSDKITTEAQISNSAKFLPLRDPQKWAQEILQYKGVERQAFQLSKSMECFSLQDQVDFFRTLIA